MGKQRAKKPSKPTAVPKPKAVKLKAKPKPKPKAQPKAKPQPKGKSRAKPQPKVAVQPKTLTTSAPAAPHTCTRASNRPMGEHTQSRKAQELLARRKQPTSSSN